MFLQLSKANLTYLPNTPFEARALDDITFGFEAEEAVGIAGPIGSGKSTLGQVMAALLRPDSGSLVIDGKDVGIDILPSQVYRYVNFLFQKPEKQLFEANVYDEVAFGPRNLGLEKDVVEKAVKRALGIVGLDFDIYKNRSPFNLSGGEMRRVGIASVLAIEAPALVMDEPTAGLDAQGCRNIITYLKDIRRQKRSLVLISHDLGEILQVCDRLIVLDKGRIVLSTTTKNVYNHLALLDKLGLYLPDNYLLANKLKICGYRVAEVSKEAVENAIEEKLTKGGA